MRFRLLPRRRRSRRSSAGWLKPATKRAVIGVIVLGVALIGALGAFGLAGPTGSGVLRILRLLFGWLGYAIPLVLVWWGYRLLLLSPHPLPRLRLIGGGLLIVGLLGIFHLVGVSAEDAFQVAIDGRGGGFVGFAVSFPLRQAISTVGASILFVAATLIGIFLTFNLSPADIGRWARRLVPYGGADQGEEVGMDEEEEADEREGSVVPTFRLRRTQLTTGQPDPAQLELEIQQEQEQRARVQRQLRAANRRYHPPSVDLLLSSTSQPNSGNVEANKQIIKNTLEQFGIAVEMGKPSIGPTVTQYTLRPEAGIKLSRITALQNDLALALSAHPIRIEAPIPNTNLVGIEIPNKDVSLVRLRDLITSKAFRRAESPLTFVLGKDVAGKVMTDTLERLPHLLIAGATGSGKSIFINTLIISLLYRNSPALVKFILVDPKRVELSVYNDIPHLLTPVIIEPSQTISALRWAVNEMDRRYRLLSESGARHLLSFNTNNPEEAQPMIVIIIDELADLMAKHAREVEGAIVRLSQMARAVGIHLVLATQRPSVNVITGLIKANIPARVAFNVASQIDSRTILDTAGAEKLLGSGDMLYRSNDRTKPVRIQGGFLSEEEVRRVVKDLQENNQMEAEYDDSIISRPAETNTALGGGEGGDPLYEQAKELVIQSGKASASLLQRRLSIGYARAARLLDVMEERGIIGRGEGNKPRQVLVRGQIPYVSQSPGASTSPPPVVEPNNSPHQW